MVKHGLQWQIKTCEQRKSITYEIQKQKLIYEKNISDETTMHSHDYDLLHPLAELQTQADIDLEIIIALQRSILINTQVQMYIDEIVQIISIYGDEQHEQ